MDLKAMVVAVMAAGGCVSETDSGAGVKVYAPRLDQEAICKLRMGSDGDRFEAGWQTGTWSDDVIGILGVPGERTRRTWFYEFTAGTSDKKARMELTFGPKPLCWRGTGKPVVPNEWLTEIRVEGMPYADCWDPTRYREDRVTCPECTSERDVVECQSVGGK